MFMAVTFIRGIAVALAAVSCTQVISGLGEGVTVRLSTWPHLSFMMYIKNEQGELLHKLLRMKTIGGGGGVHAHVCVGEYASMCACMHECVYVCVHERHYIRGEREISDTVPTLTIVADIHIIWPVPSSSNNLFPLFLLHHGSVQDFKQVCEVEMIVVYTFRKLLNGSSIVN